MHIVRHGKQVARNAWGWFTEAHRWFRINPCIESTIKFVCKQLEAHYIDELTRIIHLETTSEWDMDFRIADIPLIAQQDSLLGRWGTDFKWYVIFSKR